VAENEKTRDFVGLLKRSMTALDLLVVRRPFAHQCHATVRTSLFDARNTGVVRDPLPTLGTDAGTAGAHETAATAAASVPSTTSATAGTTTLADWFFLPLFLFAASIWHGIPPLQWPEISDRVQSRH
jgi:hypothetical protein